MLSIIGNVLWIVVAIYMLYVVWCWRKAAKKVDQMLDDLKEEAYAESRYPD